MMPLHTTQGAGATRIKTITLAGAGEARVAERAFESFVVMLWQMALTEDNVSSWMRACEHLYALRLFLDRMRLPHLAEGASDLMAVAGCHAETATASHVNLAMRQSERVRAI